MIPLISTVKEMENQAAIVRRVAEEVFKEKGRHVHYLVGTMIELPRACLVADEIAKEAEFFSFGTNDLTQTTFGFSRDDVGKILTAYLAEGILKQDPFAAIDQVGVGELVKIGIERGRKTRPKLEVGICGEHGGDPSSVEFCHKVGMDYVSCSPFRVLTARLAAAQAGASDKLKVEGGRTKIAFRTKGTKSNGLRVLSFDYCTFCKRAISFCARLSSDSDQSRRELAPLFFSTLTENSTSFATLSRILARVWSLSSVSGCRK